MSNKLQPVRGTHDILPDEFEKFNAVVTTARELATLYGFREMATPIFEVTEVFSRSMGETSDVVSKEMFTFETRGGESVTLRPEFTAGIARAFISNGMQQNLPLKLFSTGPLFRYERPQKGRQRQFHQVNFEWLGDDSWQADVEVITLAGHLLRLFSDGCVLHINTLGDKESREKYRDALVSYLTPFTEQLSEDSKHRLVTNPLRILDSKDSGDKQILSNAPVMTDYLSVQAKERFENICNALKSEGTPSITEIKIDPALVRGLDYYTDTVFEFVANTGELGAQNTVLAGGRYDGLIEQMGGKPTPAIGFASGVERFLLLAEKKWIDENKAKIFILPEEASEEMAISIAFALREKFFKLKEKISVEIYWQGSLKKRMEKADKNSGNYVVIVPSDGNNISVKDMKTGIQQEYPVGDIKNIEKLKEIFNIA